MSEDQGSSFKSPEKIDLASYAEDFPNGAELRRTPSGWVVFWREVNATGGAAESWKEFDDFKTAREFAMTRNP